MPTAIEIFRRLIDDPDYQAKNGKSREEVVWEEAKQRERQHRNNNAALSLAWTDTPTVKSLIEFLYKADEEGESEEIPKISFFGPLEAILRAIQVHKDNEQALPWAGSDRVGTLASLITPHIDALKTILDRQEDIILTPPESDLYDHRKRLNIQVNGTDEEDTTGEFQTDVLINLLNRYSNLEQDMRAIGNEIRDGRRLLRIGNSNVTQDKPISPSTEEEETFLFPRERRAQTLETWYNLLNNGGERGYGGRLQVLEAIERYLPVFSDLPDSETQENMLRPHQKVQGMYGNRAIGADIDNFEDSLNRAATRQFLEQTGYQLPSNRAFDYTRSTNEDFSPETEASLRVDFNNFMRLTFWNPDKARGASNLWDILQGTVKKSDSDSITEGYYKLPPEIVDHLANMSDESQNEFLNDIINNVDPIKLLNPDNKGNSGINTVIEEYSNLDTRIRESSVRGRHSSQGFNVVQNPSIERKRPVYQLLAPKEGETSPLQSLMADLGVIIDVNEFDDVDLKDAIENAVSEINPNGLYDNHFPFKENEPYVDLDEIVPEGTDEGVKRAGRAILAGNPLPDTRGRSRDLFKTEDENGVEIPIGVKLSEMRSEANKKAADIRTLIENVQKRDHDYNSRVISGRMGDVNFGSKYAEMWNNRKSTIENTTQRLKLIGDAERAVYDRKREGLNRKIDGLERIPREQTEIDNPYLEEEQADYIDEFRDSAIQYLQSAGIDGTEEQIEELMANEEFKRGYEPPKVRTKILQDPRPLTDEEEAELAGYKEQYNMPIEYSSTVTNLQTTLNKQSDALQIETNPLIEAYINAGIETRDIQWKADMDAMRGVAMPFFIETRKNDLNEIIDYMKENGVTASKASQILDIPLNAEEKDFFNEHPSSQPLITSGIISGDLATEMAGRSIPRDVAFPTLNLSFDGRADIEKIKAIVNNHPTFKELQNLLNNLEIDFGLLDSSRDRLHGEHQFPLYNPERLRRSLVPFKLEDGQPKVDPLDGPLEQTEDGKWVYKGTLFDHDIDKLLSFMNEADLSRSLEAISDLSPETIRGDMDDPIIVDKYISQEDLNKYYVDYEDINIPEGDRSISHYEMEDGTLVPAIIPRQHEDSAWERIDDATTLESEWEFKGNKHGSTTRSKYGLGEEASKRPDAEYEYLKNIFNVIADNEANPEVFATRRQAPAEQMREAQEEKQKNESGKIESVSGLPQETINKFTALMYRYHNEAIAQDNVNTYDYVVPEVLKDYIKRNLPIFNAQHSGHEQEHLDSFLTNFYRQFKKGWEERYSVVYESVKNDPVIQGGIGDERGLAAQVEAAVKQERERLGLSPTGNPIELRAFRRKKERELIEDYGQAEFEELRTAVGPEIIDEMLSEQHGRLGPTGAIERQLSPKALPEPVGGTHIPISISGVLQDALIPTIPILAQFPIQRFQTGKRMAVIDEGIYEEIDDEGNSKPLAVPIPWLWIREQAEYLEAFARSTNQPLARVLKDMIDEDGLVTTGLIATWLENHKFIGQQGRSGDHSPSYEDGTVNKFKDSTLPNKLVPHPEKAVVQVGPKLEGKEKNIQQFRNAIVDINKTREIQQQKADLRRQELGIADYSAIPGDTSTQRLKNISQTPEIQELLNSIYGSPEDLGILTGAVGPEGVRRRQEENLIDIAGLDKDETVMPQREQTEEGEFYWDLSYMGEDVPFVTGLYARLLKFADGFTPRTTAIRGPDGEWLRDNYDQFTGYDDEGNELIYRQPDPDTDDPTSEELQVMQEAGLDFSPRMLDDANTFTLMDNIFRLIDHLREVHISQRMELPYALTRKPGMVPLVPGDLDESIKNLSDKPLDANPEDPTVMIQDLEEHFPEEYFKDYDNKFMGLKSPASAKDIATQISGMRKYLKSALEIGSTVRQDNQDFNEIIDAVRSYINDLENAAQEFNIPDIDVVSKFMLQSKGKEHALEQRIINEDGTFNLFDVNGNVDATTRAFLSPIYAERRTPVGKDTVVLRDVVLRNTNIIDSTPTEERHINIQEPVMDVLKTLNAYGEQFDYAPFKHLLKPDGSVNYGAVRNLMGMEITPSSSGLERLLIGKPQDPNSKRDTYKPGILAWLHNHWSEITDGAGERPSRYARDTETSWASGNSINTHLRSIIDREGTAQPIEEVDEPSEQEVLSWDEDRYKDYLSKVEDGAIDPDELDDILESDGVVKFQLDQDEIADLRAALDKGGYENKEDILKKYDKTKPEQSAQSIEPEEIEPIKETESPTNLTIPNVEPNVETDPNIASSSNPLTDTIPGLNEGTQMDMFDNEENQ